MRSIACDSEHSIRLVPALLSLVLAAMLSFAAADARAGEEATSDGTATGTDLSSGQTTAEQAASSSDSQAGQNRCSTSIAMQEYVAACNPNSRLFWRPSPNRGGSSR